MTDPLRGPVDGEAGMDWIGWVFVLVVVAAAVGVVLERRRRRNRLGGPGHSEEHRAGAPAREPGPGDAQQVDQRHGGFMGG